MTEWGVPVDELLAAYGPQAPVPAVAPDGTPWGSFTQDCGPSRESSGCVKQHDQTRGFAGHLG